MAFVGNPVWEIGFAFIDNNDKVAVTTCRAPGLLSAAQVTSLAEALATKLQAISDAHLSSYNVLKTFRNDAIRILNPSSEVERKLFIPMSDATGYHKATMDVPSPIFALEISGTDIINEANGLWIDLANELTKGNINPNNGPVTMSGADITKLGRPYMVHRHRRPTK